jgi:hypothetical protein
MAMKRRKHSARNDASPKPATGKLGLEFRPASIDVPTGDSVEDAYVQITVAAPGRPNQLQYLTPRCTTVTELVEYIAHLQLELGELATAAKLILVSAEKNRLHPYLVYDDDKAPSLIR